MLYFTNSAVAETQCCMSYGSLGHVNRAQPPLKRKPFSSVLNVPFVHKVEIILPIELFDIVKDDLAAKIPKPMYSRVTMPLHGLLEGGFFNQYIKIGNVLMLSEGRRGIDNIFCLKDGILTLMLDKESYERAGLVGKPDGAKAKRSTRPRWIVEINLRLPSMLHGKKVFDRTLHAFKNTLTAPVTWLFADLSPQALSTDPQLYHFPTVTECPMMISTGPSIQTPCLQPLKDPSIYGDDEFTEFATDLYEWLSLVSLDSPRVDVNDNIDSFLSRYSTPNSSNTKSNQLVRLTWKGFMPSVWAHKALMQALDSVTSEEWFSFTVSGFSDSISGGSRDITLLKLPGTSCEYILWEVGGN